MKNNNNLPRYVRVNAGVKAYSSAMHGELYQQLCNLIAAQDKQKLHLTDELLKAWNDLIMQEVELNNAQRASRSSSRPSATTAARQLCHKPQGERGSEGHRARHGAGKQPPAVFFIVLF